MKKITTLAIGAALFAVALVPALAAGNSCGNGTTGPFSTNNCTINNTSDVDVKNYNDAKITNDVNGSANSGHNNASGNTLGGTIQTGNATLNATVSTIANINTTNITGGATMGTNNGFNQITGPGGGGYGKKGGDSINSVYINNSQDVDVDNQNTAKVKNDVDVKSDTGYNKADTNTGPGMVSTGNAYTGLSVGNHVNDNYTRIQAGAGGTGTNSAGNSTTGPFSDNDVTLNNTVDVSVKNYNDLYVKNDVDAKSSAGHNKANENTLGGTVETGWAKTGVDVDTEGNINTTSVLAALGGFANGGSNEITGPGSDNNTYLNNVQEIEVENLNNKCESHNASSIRNGRECEPWKLGVKNFVDAYSDTGDNWAKENTGGGSVYAAMADLFQNVVTHLNDTLTTITQ